MNNSKPLATSSAQELYERIKNLQKGSRIEIAITYHYKPEEITLSMIEYWVMYNANIIETTDAKK